MRMGLFLGLGMRGGSGIASLTMTGLTDGEARPGDHASISVGFPTGVTAWTSQAWGTSYGDTTYGTGASPTDYTAGDGGTLFWEGEGDDGNTYRASAPIRYAEGTAPAVADGQSWVVDDTAVNLDGAASGTGLTFSYALSGVPSDITINSGTGAITGTLDFANTGPNGSGTGTITATDQYGRILQDTFTWSHELRAKATGGTDLDLSFPVDSAIPATDLTANWTENGNTVTYAITGTALPTGLSVSSAGSMTGTPTAVTADATYTLRGTDEYGRTTDDTFTLKITSASSLTSFSITENTGDTPDAVSVTSDEAGTVYAGVYPNGTVVGDVTPSALVAGNDTDQIGNAYDIGTLTAGGGNLTDIDISPVGLTGGTDYFLAVVQDIDDNGTYTNVVGGNFTENIPSFAPDSLASIEQWYDAGDESTITTATGVSALADKSGNSYDLAQATTTAQPETGNSANDINFRNVITFDGTDDVLEDLSHPFNVDGTIFIVFQPISVATVNDSVASYDASNDFQIDANAPSAFTGRVLPNTHSDLDATAVNKNGTTIILMYRFDATANTAQLYIGGGAAEATAADYTTDYDATQDFRLGTNRTAAFFLNMHFCEFIRYSTALSASDANDVGNYLETRWGPTWTDIS